MFRQQIRLSLFAVLAACMLALTGCGGGGGGGEDPPMMPEPPPMQEPEPDPVAVTIPDAMYLDEDNAPEAGHHDIAAGMTATNNGVTFLCAAGGDDCEVDVMADGSVTATGGMVTASLTADAMEQVADAKEMKAEEDEAMALAARDRLIGKDRAIEAAANLGLTATAGLDEDEIIVSRSAGAAARVRSTGYVPSEMSAPANGDWAGTRLMQTVTGATNHLFVYTDIDPPTRIQFYNWDGDDTTPSRYPDTVTDALTAPADATTVITPLDIDASAALFNRGSLDAVKFMSPGPAEGGNVTQRFPMPNVGAQITSFQGNYNGAAGTYSCDSGTAGAACVVTISPSGTYTAATGDWTFTPELNATAWRGDQDFISFGWWLQEPTSANGAYTFRYYADGNSAYTAPDGTGTNNIAAGTATYNGRASGKYVVQEVGDSGVTGGSASIFTAAATLTANFSTTANSISGRIHDIVGEDGAMSGWEVTLHRKTLGAQTALGGLFPAATQSDPELPLYNGTTATMGDQTAHGDWTGQFFGNTPAVPNAYPTGVGGTFQADNDEVSIAGAFGARR